MRSKKSGFAMFKLIFRVAVAFAVVWMLAPHGPGIAFVRPGLTAAMHYFGWQHTPGDVDRRPEVALNRSASAGVPSAAHDCVTPAAPQRRGPNGSVSAPACPDPAGRQSTAAPQ
jgi:hypothetical protein